MELKIPRDMKCMLYVLGLMEILAQQGYVSGNPFPLTDDGKQHFGILVDDGFSMTESELSGVTQFFVDEKVMSEEERESIQVLLIHVGNITDDRDL